MKANPMPEVVQHMSTLTQGLDVASRAELEVALATGTAPRDISFAGPGKSAEDLHNLALANLARLGRNGLDEASAEAVLLQSGDGFDASRVLLLEQQEGLLVAVPDRDTLWAGPEDGQNLESLMSATEDIADRAAHPISGKVFRVRDGRLEPVEARR